MTQSSSNWIHRGLDAASKTIDQLQFAAPLLTRLVVGITFVYTGRGKLANLDRTTGFFSDLGIPFPAANALFISCLELVGGICLILGLGTRMVAALLSATMVVALLTADRETIAGKFPADLTDVSPFVLLIFLTWLVLYGAGSIGLDRIVGRWFRRDKAQWTEA